MPSRLPSIIALQCLETSERLGSFTRAADLLNITQGAVSRQVIGLERSLGVQLLVRRREALVATAAGRAYLMDVRPLLHRLKDSTAEISLHQGRGGRLHLSAPSSFCNYWLAPRLSGFVHTHAHITLNLSTYLGSVDFGPGGADAAIMVVSAPAPGLTSTLIQKLVVRPYASDAIAQRFASQDFAAVIQNLPSDLTLIHNTSLPRAWEMWARESGSLDAAIPSLSAGPGYDLMSMSLHAATAGIGVALLPDFMARNAVEMGQLQALSQVEWVSDRAYYLCYPERNASLPSLTQFAAWLTHAD
jgi:LysR family glycine cleavage system transcriptional activator